MRILSLDWDASYQADLTAELEACGHEVETFARAADALARSAAHPFDLFVLETRLPDKTGLQFLRELKAARTSAPRVVFLTDLNDPEMRSLCLTEGAARYLSKKDGWAAVVSEIHGVLGEFATAAPPVLVAPAKVVGRDEPKIFRGNVETIELLDVIQLLTLGKKTGVLVLSGGPREGRVFFHDGEIVAARTEEVTGVAAFSDILTIRRGTFRFEAGPLRVERTIHEPTSSLLLEALRIQDEQGRTRHDDAPGGVTLDEPPQPASALGEHDGLDSEPEEALDDWLYTGVADMEVGPRELGQLAAPRAAGELQDEIAPVARKPVPAEDGALLIDLLQDPLPRVEMAGQRWEALPDRADYRIASHGMSRNRTAALVAVIGIALLGSGYVLFAGRLGNPTRAWTEAPRRSANQELRDRWLQAADEQARIDSLEQLLQQLTGRPVASDDGAPPSARITVLEERVRHAGARRKAEDPAAQSGSRGAALR